MSIKIQSIRRFSSGINTGMKKNGSSDEVTEYSEQCLRMALRDTVDGKQRSREGQERKKKENKSPNAKEEKGSKRNPY